MTNFNILLNQLEAPGLMVRGAKLPGLTVTRGRLSEQVAQQLQELIISGELRPDDRLPPERELADQLGVSRTVIREATKSLEQRGLLEVLTGSGTYVSQMDPKVVSDSIGLLVRQSTSSFDYLNEIRRMLEVEIAGLAAERATPRDIEVMDRALQAMDEAVSELGTNPALDDFVEADLAFHNALAKATRNPLLPVLLEPITGLLVEFRHLASRAPGAPEDAVSYHRQILEQVKARDGAACREMMRKHLSKAEEWMLSAGDHKE
jgi:GntR family transcriptional repressor for pyruvate dehydrogenase complex